MTVVKNTHIHPWKLFITFQELFSDKVFAAAAIPPQPTSEFLPVDAVSAVEVSSSDNLPNLFRGVRMASIKWEG